MGCPDPILPWLLALTTIRVDSLWGELFWGEALHRFSYVVFILDWSSLVQEVGQCGREGGPSVAGLHPQALTHHMPPLEPALSPGHRPPRHRAAAPHAYLPHRHLHPLQECQTHQVGGWLLGAWWAGGACWGRGCWLSGPQCRWAWKNETGGSVGNVPHLTLTQAVLTRHSPRPHQPLFLCGRCHSSLCASFPVHPVPLSPSAS